MDNCKNNENEKNERYYTTYILGNPTRLAPIPNPAPPRALDAMDGTNTSSTENVAAAIRAIITISSGFNAFLGIAKAAIANTNYEQKMLWRIFRNLLRKKRRS